MISALVRVTAACNVPWLLAIASGRAIFSCIGAIRLDTLTIMFTSSLAGQVDCLPNLQPLSRHSRVDCRQVTQSEAFVLGQLYECVTLLDGVGATHCKAGSAHKAPDYVSVWHNDT